MNEGIGCDARRPFSLVAVGGYPLHLLRFARDETSLLNHAEAVRLEGWTERELATFLAQLPGPRWGEDEIRDLHHWTHGHPHLVKQFLARRVERGFETWLETAKDLFYGQTHFALPAFTQAQQDDDLRRALEACASPEGHRVSMIDPEDPGHRLYYSGAVIRDEDRYRLCRSLDERALRGNGEESEV